MVLVRPRERLTTKIDSKNSLYPLSHFTEHLVSVFGKLPRENNLDYKSSRLSIRWLNSTPEIQPATNLTQSGTTKQLINILSSTWCAQARTRRTEAIQQRNHSRTKTMPRTRNARTRCSYGQSTVLVRAGISGARRSELRSAANRIGRPAEIRDTELAMRSMMPVCWFTGPQICSWRTKIERTLGQRSAYTEQGTQGFVEKKNKQQRNNRPSASRTGNYGCQGDNRAGLQIKAAKVITAETDHGKLSPGSVVRAPG
jgi:hypothetical protein